MMDSILDKIALKIFDYFGPKVIELIEKKLNEWLPIIMKTIAVSVAQSAGQLIVNTEDKITDIIPGKLDDNILDTLTSNVFDELHKLGFL